jgi:DNA-directed RNA polymerase subunit L
MKLLPSLERAVPKEHLAPAALLDLITNLQNIKNAIESSVSTEQKAKLDNLDNIINKLTQLDNDLSIDDTPTAAKTIIENAVALFPDDKRQEILNSQVYQKTFKLLDQWEQISAPISSQTDGFNRNIEFDKDYDTEFKDFQIGVRVGATGIYNINVLTKKQAQTLLKLEIADTECLVNQTLSAAYEVNASGSGAINFINISASLAQAGELKLDTYFQAENNTPTYRALWAMFKAPVVPWSLKSVNALLTVPNSGAGLGYRACALKTGSSFTIQGEMGVGKSLITQTDLKGNVIDIDFSAEISASHQHTITGDVSMFVTKHASSGKPLLKITIEETDERTNALNLALQAQIKGLDKLAGQYVEMLLSKGNKIVQWLEENSSPGATLLESLDNNVDKDKWYKPIASLALGQESVDDAVESLIGNELQNVIDRIPLSNEDDAEELADKVVTKLLDIFGASDSTAIENYREAAEQALQAELETLQQHIRQQADKFKGLIEGEAKEMFKPLEALGKEVKQAVTQFDDDIEKNFNKIISKYREFKEKITSALEKSANIKLGLAYDDLRKRSKSLSHSLELLLEAPDSVDVQTFYRSLAIGDDKKVASMLPSLVDKGKVKILAESTAIETMRNNTTTLSLSIIGKNITSVKDVLSQLNVKVDTSGNLFVRQEYKVTATASGLGETREAVLNMIYGIAQASQNPDFVGSVGFNYTNKDSKLHSVNEISEFLRSLDFSNDPHFNNLPNDVSVPTLIPAYRINAAIAEFNKIIKQTPTQFTTSEININLRASKQTYQRLLGLNCYSLFNNAIAYLIYLTKRDDFYQEAMEDIVEIYEEHDSKYADYNELFALLLGSPNSTNISLNTIKNDLKNEDRFKKLMKRKSKLMYDEEKVFWRKINSKLEKYAQMAGALRNLPTTLNAIANAVDNFSVTTQQKADLERLNATLKVLNKKFQRGLDDWVEVDGIVKNAIDDLYSKFGWAKSSVNLRLLSFLLLLQETVGEDEELFLTTITLSNASDERRVIVV